jgi:hypothetical protein
MGKWATGGNPPTNAMNIDRHGNLIETAPDGRRYLAGFYRPYQVITTGGQKIVFHGRSREEAHGHAESRLREAREWADSRGWHPLNESVASCEALHPESFPHTPVGQGVTP